MKHRWPHSIHSQVEAVFHSIRSIRELKINTPLGIRSFGSWKIYKYEAHRFVIFMFRMGHRDILDTKTLLNDIIGYLEGRLAYYVKKKRSRQTFETTLSALGKFIYAVNNYIALHTLPIPLLEAEEIRMDFYNRSKTLLKKSSRIYDNRAYPNPIGLIASIKGATFQLQASLQYEGGLRTEGAGAPSHRRLKNPLNKDCLLGIGSDPVTGFDKGIVESKEKGGKVTKHYVSVETYRRLEEHLDKNGDLKSDYLKYLEAINEAAKATGQYVLRRGSHGLKHNFGQERYNECINCDYSHEHAMQQTSLEMSHFRLRETLTYTRG